MPIAYFTESAGIETNVLEQLLHLANCAEVTEIAVFPDIHYCSEKGIPVGLAFATTDVIFPLVTGKDMGCGVAYMQIPKADVLKPFDKKAHYAALNKAHFQMTDEGLGGGNHFLALEEDDSHLYIMVHTGTRNRGIYMYQKNTMLLQEYGRTDWLPVSYLQERHPGWFTEYNGILEYGKQRRAQFLTGTLSFLQRNGYVRNDVQPATGDSIHNHIRQENGRWIHRKGSTELNNDIVVVPLSMTRGSLLVQQQRQYAYSESSHLNSSSHGAGRQLSRTDTLKYWHSSLKERERREYMASFPELLDRSGRFSKGYVQEFDFAYKDSSQLLANQPFLRKITETRPICTVKFTEI